MSAHRTVTAPSEGARLAKDRGHDGWILQDADGVIHEIGSTRDALFGWPTGDLVDQAAPNLVHPDDRPIAWAVRNRVRVSGQQQSLQIRVRARSGRWLWTAVEFHAVAGEDGAIGAFTLACLTDVSATYAGQEALQLLVELRRHIADAPSVYAAWQTVLARVAVLSGFTEAAVWERTGSAPTATHHWTASVADDDAQPTGPPVVASTLASSVEQVWTDAAATWTEAPAGDGVAGSAGRLFVAPMLAFGEVVGAVVFGGGGRGTDVGDDARDTLLVEVVEQLGDAVRRKVDEIELAMAKQRFELAFEGAAIGMALVAPDGTFLQANDSLCELLGRSHDELSRIGFQAVTHPEDLEADLALVHRTLAGEISGYQMEKRYIRADGEILWATLSVSLVRDGGGDPVHFISQIQDVTPRMRALRELERSVARFRAAFDDSALGMFLLRLDEGAEGEVVEANGRLASIVGRPTDRIVGSSLDDLIALDDDVVGRLLRLERADEAVRAEVPLRSEGVATDRWVRLVAAPVRYEDAHDGRFAVVQIEDITEERRVQEELAHRAMHDTLTGLPNRLLMLDRIRTAQERSDRSGRHVGLLFLDLDNFKVVNDSRGHQGGDQLLEAVAERFTAVLRPSDTAARFGGDEFVVLVEELSEDVTQASAELVAISESLHGQFVEPFLVAGQPCWISASIGSNLFRGVEQSVRSILAGADSAMYLAKARGRSRTEIYDAAVRNRATQRHAIADELRFAIEREQLHVAYQPIVELDGSARRVGHEALLRWEHPELGNVRPDVFIDVAEESDMIVDLGRFVTDQVCEAVAAGRLDGYVTINVSARQLSRSDFVAQLYGSIDRTGVDVERLAIELTESVLVDVSGSSRGQLAELRDAGMGVGIDDFGTGFASLRYVKDLPVSFLKIDRTFTAGIEHDRGDLMISKAVIGLADALGLDVIAEGVETAGQAQVLTELGCPHAQGYFFGRPAPLLG